MKINGHEVKPRQIWKRSSGDLAVITKIDDSPAPIKILILASPKSASNKHTFEPSPPRQMLRLSAIFVFPTPPFPEATAIILVI